MESEEMMADDGDVVTDDDEYDEDIDESEADDEETWNKLSTPKFSNGIDMAGSTTTTPKSTDTVSSTPSMIDPYFTHFDPRSEHQSYKVKMAALFSGVHFSFEFPFQLKPISFGVFHV